MNFSRYLTNTNQQENKKEGFFFHLLHDFDKSEQTTDKRTRVKQKIFQHPRDVFLKCHKEPPIEEQDLRRKFLCVIC